MAGLYGCSSSSDDGANMQVQDLQDQIAALNSELGEGGELTPEALAALIQAKADAEAALADAMIAHQAALAAAAMDAETAKTAALAAAAMEAMTAQEAALAAAAMEAMTAQEAALAAAAMEAMTAHDAALAAAAMEAMTAQEAALAAAAMEAMTAHDAALAAAAMEAMTAQEAALAAAAMEAMTAHDAALAAAAMEAMTAHDAALAAAAIAAADMAAADKAAALADAKTAADAAQAMALADAKTAADAAQAMALADAKTAADAAQAMALADAKTAADAAQAMALADAKTAADAAQAMALADAKTAADAAQAMALADAKMAADAAQVVALDAAKMAADAAQVVALDAAKMAADAAQVVALADAKMAADAALKVVQDDLDEFKRKNSAIIAANEAKEASDMAKAVLMAIGGNTPDALADPANASPATVKVSSAGVLTATQAGYTMSAAPEEIDGWRGRTLANDGDTTVIYTNIADAVATPIGGLYRSTTLQGKTAAYRVTHGGADESVGWGDVKRADDVVTETGDEDDLVAMFSGSVSGVAGVFSCAEAAEATCKAPTETDDGTLGKETGAWTFTPTDPNGTIDVADTDYVSFGWWLNAMGTQGAYEFDAFARATGPRMALNMGAGGVLEGSATYKGGAAGKYAILSTTDDSAEGGHFTATATLAVNFDANTATDIANPTEDGVSIGGTITDFMTGETSRPNWKVTLSYDDAGDDGVQFPTEVKPISGVRATTKWSTGGAVDGVGTWNANFYGVEDDTMHPMAAIGEFNAAIGRGDIGRISGAFGATKQ